MAAKTSYSFLFQSKQKLKGKFMARDGISRLFCQIPSWSLGLHRTAFDYKGKRQTYPNTANSVLLDWPEEGEEGFSTSHVMGANCSFHAHLSKSLMRGSLVHAGLCHLITRCLHWSPSFVWEGG